MSEIDLDELRVATPCKIPWDSMKGDETRRYCSQCHMNVYKIAEMSPCEAVRLVGKDTDYSFSLYTRPDGTVITKDCPIAVKRFRRNRKIIAALIVSIFASAYFLNQNAISQYDQDLQRQLVYAEAGRDFECRLSANGKLVVSKTNIRKGELFSPQTVEEIEVNQEKIPVDSLHSMSLLEGKAARTFIEAGQIIDQREVMDAIPKSYRLRLDKKTEERALEIAERSNQTISQLMSNWIRDQLP